VALVCPVVPALWTPACGRREARAAGLATKCGEDWKMEVRGAKAYAMTQFNL
jgi:hypothetical protein